MLKSFKIYTCTNGSLGLHLSRAPWDPYPWVSSIQKESTSYVAGLRVGDCLLELNGNDVLGLKISEIAGILKNHWLTESSNHVSVVIWRNKAKDATDVSEAEEDDDEDEENNAHNINQQSLQKFATCLQHIAQLLECPVCLEVIKPPGWQCCNGHVLCNNCRSRSEKCPVCRVPLGPRGRCLLSDKLFTLLADSFPCDGVRSNKSSPKDRRKCSTEFHNQPKMAIVSKQQHQDEDDVKAKDFKKSEQDFILSSLRMGRRRRTKTKKDETEGNQEGEQENKRSHHSMLARAVYDATNAAVNVQVKSDEGSNSRKSSEDYSAGVSATSTVQVPVRDVEGGLFSTTMTTTTLSYDELLEDARGSAAAQCHCRKCYKPDKVAMVNNVMAATTATSNKYILRVQAQQQEENVDHYLLHQQQQKYQNYQCPTGKLCCLQRNVMANAVYTTQVATTYHQQDQQQPHQMTNNNLSRKQTTSDSIQSTNDNTTASTSITKNVQKMLRNEWEILAHLTQDHQLAVNQYYAEYGQRIAINHDVLQKTAICLNLRGSEPSAKIEKFFVAFIPMAAAQTNHQQRETVATTSSSSSPVAAAKVAVFVWHMNALPNNGHSTSATAGAAPSTPVDDDDEVSNFDAIIENPKTGIKWFGRAHCLTTPWSHIYHKQHFLMHELVEGHTSSVPVANGTGGDGDAFVIVIKSKS